MREATRQALQNIADSADRLSRGYRFDWPVQCREATCALLYLTSKTQADSPQGGLPLPLVAVVGGASSGKSTIFNNLLEGRLASRVTAKGHATRGLIAAAHEDQRPWLQCSLDARLLFPSLTPAETAIDGNIDGEPGEVSFVYHRIEALRDVVLFDTPDFTSEPAKIEGDITLAALPWFDQLIVVIDHERWFDRQAVSQLRDLSSQFGQSRFAVFNRSKSGELAVDEIAKLEQQAARIGAGSHLIIEFRHGRGCCLFPPATLKPLTRSIRHRPEQRVEAIVRQIGARALRVLNANDERQSRLADLHDALHRAAAERVPSRAACMASLLTTAEREHLDVITRTLRIHETKAWLSRQTRKIRSTIQRKLPLIGGLLGNNARPTEDDADLLAGDRREELAWALFETRATRQINAVAQAAGRSRFWSEIRSWTSLEPPAPDAARIADHRPQIVQKAEALDAAITAWIAKVESECKGVSPHVVGALGATTLAGAVILIAVSGPIGALTLPAAKLALSGAIGTLLSSAGAGALAGRPLGRLLNVVHERLIGSREFDAVRLAIDAIRDDIAGFGEAVASRSYAEAQQLVVPADDDLLQALSTVCHAAGVA